MVGSEVKEKTKQGEVKRPGQTSWENEGGDVMKNAQVHGFRPFLAGGKLER